MKKYAILTVIFLLGGCAWMNPLNWWGSDKNETVKAGFEPNPFLWQAATDQLAFMNSLEEDKSKGTISKEWTTAEGNKKIQYTVGVRILSEKLRSDCLEVVVAKRLWNGQKWVDQPENSELDRKVEESILNRARVLYQKSLNL